jgi:GH15 family glucan-1,4-alpha-glucosidase
MSKGMYAQYYYQMNKNKEVWLKDKWMCCGALRDYGIEDEIKKTVQFYKEYFAKNDSRYGAVNGKYDGDFKVIIVNGFFGNVPGRDDREIEESDIVEKYNFS